MLAGIADPTGDLRYAKAELDIIGETFPHARLRFGADATTAQLLTDVAGAGYVHLACHGEYDVGDPLASKVVLHDGALTLRDLIGLTAFASVRLVTASACQTGITDVVRLPDEAVGLPAGFLQSGAAGVVATLWSVQDASTALLMSRFYELLSGRDADGTPAQPPPAALRQAQLWLRDLSGEAFGQYATARPALESRFGRALDFARAFPDIRPFAGPYHWAPFVFVGA
ncbi:MAG: CHAT domain-containing protein [Acidimicrobiia bacterium]